MGEWEAWIKAGTGDDKTEIVVIADFWKRTGGIFSRDRDFPVTPLKSPGAEAIFAASINLAVLGSAHYYRGCFSVLAVHRYLA